MRFVVLQHFLEEVKYIHTNQNGKGNIFKSSCHFEQRTLLREIPESWLFILAESLDIRDSGISHPPRIVLLCK